MDTENAICREFKKLLDSGVAKLVPDYTGAAAQRYDSIQDEKDDVGFFVKLAGKPCKVLELGCGTGRITIPLAKAGHKVLGIDNSADMLSILKGKLDGGLKEAITLREASIADFRTEETFDLVIIGYNTIFHLTKAEERRACMANARQYLRAGGRLALNARFTFPRDSKMTGGSYFFMTEDAKPGEAHFCVMRGEHDPKTQISVDNYMYVSVGPDGKAEISITPSIEYHPSPGEFRELIGNAGFKIETFDYNYPDSSRPASPGRADTLIVAVAV